MRPRPRKPEKPRTSRITIVLVIVVLVAVQLGLIAWLGNQGVLVLLDAGIVGLAIASALKIKRLFGFQIYQATAREIVVAASVCLALHAALFVSVDYNRPHRRPPAAAGDSAASAFTTTYDAPNGPERPGPASPNPRR